MPKTATVEKKSGFSPVKTGIDPRIADAPKKWMKIDPNSSVDFTCLVEVDEIVSCEQCAIWLTEGNSPVWVYLGAEDPSHDLGIAKRYRAFLPVLVEGEVQVLPMGIQIHKQLMEIADAIGSIKGQDFRMKRTGSGIATRYMVTNKATRKDISDIDEVDVIAMLGPLTVDGVHQLIAERLGVPDYEAVLAMGKGKTITAALGKKTPAAERGKHVRPETEDEELPEEEDVRLI